MQAGICVLLDTQHGLLELHSAAYPGAYTTFDTALQYWTHAFCAYINQWPASESRNPLSSAQQGAQHSTSQHSMKADTAGEQNQNRNSCKYALRGTELTPSPSLLCYGVLRLVTVL